MLDVIYDGNVHLYRTEMETIYRFRHWYFVDRMKWEPIRREDGREIDQFDNETAIHLAHFDRGRPLSYSRLLPTDRPHLLSDVYPELMDGEDYDTGADIFEWTRFSVDPVCGNPLKFTGENQYIIYGVAEYCVQAGIRRLIVETHPLYMSWLLEMDWKVKPISVPRKVEGSKVVVFEAEPNQDTIKKGREMLGISEPVVYDRMVESENFKWAS